VLKALSHRWVTYLRPGRSRDSAALRAAP
jgi:hypothetical protein